MQSPPSSFGTSRPVHALGVSSQNCRIGIDINKDHGWKLALRLVDLPNTGISNTTNINNDLEVFAGSSFVICSSSYVADRARSSHPGIAEENRV